MEAFTDNLPIVCNDFKAVSGIFKVKAGIMSN